MTRKRTNPHPCPSCGETVTRDPLKVRTPLYCSPGCRVIAQTGEPLFELSPDGASAQIPLRARDGSVRAYTTVDAADAEWLSKWRWCLDKNGYVTRKAYLGGGGANRQMVNFRLHRELLGLPPATEDDREVDHRDLDKLNNRRSNLLIVTHAQQMQNRPSLPGSSSRYRGVYWSKARQRWVASVKTGGKTHHFGHFSSEEAAAKAARAGRSKLLPFATD
jgi:hypothetical protein